MKKFAAVLAVMLCLPAYAEIAPVGYWDDQESVEAAADEATDAVPAISDQTAPATVAPQQTTVHPIAAPVVAPVVSGRSAVVSRTATASRAMPAVQATTAPRAVAPSRAVASRSAAATNYRAGYPVNSQPVVTSRRATSGGSATVARAGIIQTDTVSSPLYNPTGTGAVGARVAIRGTPSSTRMPSVRSAATTATATTSAADAVTAMDELAQMSDYCKSQFFSCMDNFCNVIDDNQGRCSCSANIAKYKDAETNLKTATEQLQQVALDIRNLGRSASEIDAMFSQTIAEQQMQTTVDNSQIQNDLTNLKKLIFEPTTGTATASGNLLGLDFSNLDFSFSDSFDFSNLFGQSSTVSNQRGAELYKTASNRCTQSVLNNCKSQGVDTALITNSYDLAIDQQCVLYERSLEDANTNMRRTIMNAQAVLQNARLVVFQDKNQYDMKGCVSALDTCMQDDFVCGRNYDNCLDPTGKYIVNGAIVSGATAAQIKSGLLNAWGTAWDEGQNATGLGGFITSNITNFANTTPNMVSFLINKIGNETGTTANTQATGMCINELKKCQNYTFTGTGNNLRYNPNNQVVKEFLMMALTQIKARQDTLVADYSGNCKTQLQSCLVTNGAIIGDSGLNVGYVTNSIYQACKSIQDSCENALGITTPGELLLDIVCYTGGTDTGSYPAWTINVSGGSRTCKCPAGTYWNNSMRNCTCSAGTWSYEYNTCMTGTEVTYCGNGVNIDTGCVCQGTSVGGICCKTPGTSWSEAAAACVNDTINAPSGEVAPDTSVTQSDPAGTVNGGIWQ